MNKSNNSPEHFLKRIERIYVDLDSAKSSHMAEAKNLRNDIKEIYTEARDAGLDVPALKGLVKYRRLERKQQAIPDAFQDDAATLATYKDLVEQLGDLGRAAAERAGALV
jgi:uncharacterized protein (UPF0335 family)